MWKRRRNKEDEQKGKQVEEEVEKEVMAPKYH